MLRPVVKETSPRANFPTGLVYLGMMRGVERIRAANDNEALWGAIADLRKEIEALKHPLTFWARLKRWLNF